MKEWKWIGHTVSGRKKGEVVKMDFDWNPKGQRRRGRPRAKGETKQVGGGRWIELRRAGKTWREAKMTALVCVGKYWLLPYVSEPRPSG